MDALPSGKRPIGRPRTRWHNYVEYLAWSCLGIPAAELPLVAGDRDAWRSQLELLPRNPKRTSGQREKHCTNSMFFLKMMMVMVSSREDLVWLVLRRHQRRWKVEVWNRGSQTFSNHGTFTLQQTFCGTQVAFYKREKYTYLF